MITEYLLDFLFPKKCVSCGTSGSWLCDACIKQIEFLDHFLIRQNFRFLSGVVAFFKFKGPLREAVHAYKYESVKELTKPLADLLTRQIKENDFKFLRHRTMLAVPMHRFKLAERGFNHSALFAEKLAEKVALPFENKILVKTKATTPQIELSGKERKQNIKNTFAVKDISAVRGKRIFLFEDVITTGSALEECAKVLKEAGARDVWALVLARD
jgi:ComF family protein